MTAVFKIRTAASIRSFLNATNFIKIALIRQTTKLLIEILKAAEFVAAARKDYGLLLGVRGYIKPFAWTLG